MIGYKTSLSNFKRTERIQSMFSSHNGLKLESSNMRKTGKFINMWKLTYSKTMSQRKNRMEIRKYFLMNENEDTTYQNLWDEAKAVFRVKCVSVMLTLKKEERSPINYLTFLFKNLEREEPIKPNRRRGERIIKIRVEIKEMENRKAIEKINETESLFFEKTKKLANL